MTAFVNEIVRNFAGYFLIFAGLISIWYGGHVSNAVLVDAGKGLVGAALLAFTPRRPLMGGDPDTTNTSTTTTSVSVPKPDSPPTPETPVVSQAAPEAK